ncbi:MAG: HIT family protein [Gammaproteobacteria bacterium]|nr:HIT family protein [Gammaproteobacteria bacterium]
MSNEFMLNPQVETDSAIIAKLEISHLRLMDNAHYTWVLLVPEVPGAMELIDLNATEQLQLLAEINQVSHILKQHFSCDKLNIAMLGNKVSQLHVHIIARRTNDACWPEPVWGGPKIAYTPEAIAGIIAKIKSIILDERSEDPSGQNCGRQFYDGAPKE